MDDIMFHQQKILYELYIFVKQIMIISVDIMDGSTRLMMHLK